MNGADDGRAAADRNLPTTLDNAGRAPDDATVRSDRTVDPWIGRVLKAKYRLERRLGSGGFGTVYAARQLLTDTWHAVKLMHAPLAPQPRMQERFREEARTGMQLNHPRIVRITDFDIEGDACFLVMDLIESRTLAERLQAKPSEVTSNLPTWTRDIAAALDYAHAHSVLHRDLKPNNILVREQDNAALLTDFGISRWVHQAGLTAEGVTLGTSAYMSPEQCRGETRAIDARSDIYAFAALLFEAVAGHPPFGSGPEAIQGHLHREPPRLTELSPALPNAAALDQALGHGLAKSPNQRPASATQLAEEFLKALSGTRLEPAVAVPPARSSSLGLSRAALWATVLRNRIPAAITALALILFIGGGVAIAASRPSSKAAATTTQARASSSAAATSSPSQAPSSKAVTLSALPASALGTWLGSVHLFTQPADRALKVTLRTGNLGDEVGEYTYPTLGLGASVCRGNLMLEAASSGSSQLTPKPVGPLINGAPECLAKRIVITPSTGSLDWKVYEEPGGTFVGQGSLSQGGAQLDLPTAYAGTWQGSVHFFGGGDYALIATIRGGKIGDIVGEYRFPGLESNAACHGILVLDSPNSASASLAPQPQGGLMSGAPGCQAKEIGISPTGGALEWKIYDEAGGNLLGQGSLAKTS
ncbi:MAG TPA: serine/threonine-protein kinase [Candidatus Dormibacteraeota bacterium]|nr:serine/threonine-protein kinase [Candidatus Dormibacteraeota bacterium]